MTFPLARSGDVWHGLVAGCPLVGVRYAYRVDGPRGWDKGHRYDPAVLLLDPRAPLVEGRSSFGDASKPPGAGRWTGAFDFASPPFDWEGTAPPAVDPAAAVVYEVGVRSFTGSPTSGLPAELRGTFLGLASKAAYLKQLGVTAVELLPVFEYDELEFTRPKPDGRLGARAHMVNTWGYSHVSFFAPATRLGTQGGGAARAAADFKVMVRELHRAGIAVWLDVVYNHTAEGGDDDPYTTSLRGIDHSEYYIVDPSGRPGGASGDAGTQVKNFSGCGAAALE